MKKDIIQYPDFQKLDLRVGQVISCTPIEKSKKLLQLMIDLGPDYGEVEILSGISEWYTPEDLIGNKYIFLANLEPRAMMGKTSNGMIFAVDTPEKPVLLQVSNEIENGLAVR